MIELIEDKSTDLKPISARSKLANTKGYRRAKPLERGQSLPKGYTVDLARALELRLKGLTDSEIAATLGVSKSAVYSRLEPFSFLVTNNGELEAYNHNEVEIFDYIRMLCSQAIIEQLQNPERREKIDLLRLNNLLGTVFDKMRLIRGQSTANISSLSRLVLDAHKRPNVQNTDTD